MNRKNELIDSLVGMVTGMCIGAAKSGPIVYVTGPVGVFSSAVIGGIIGLLGGNKVGSEIDRYKH